MKTRIHQVLVLLLLSVLIPSVSAQKRGNRPKDDTYKITIRLEGVPDTMLYIGYYYADKTYSRDSIFVDARNPYTFVLHGHDTLRRGVYIVAGQRKNKYLEFVVDSSFFFTIEAKNLQPPFYDILSHLTFENSPENVVFLDFQQKMAAYQGKTSELNRSIRQESAKENASKKIIRQLQDEVALYYDSMNNCVRTLINEHPKQLFAKLQKLGLEPEVPEVPKGEDSSWQYRYYVNHYWDNADLSDDGLIYSPLFYPRLKRYYEKVAPNAKDSLIHRTDMLIEKISSPELFKYVVWYVTSKYERSKYVGQDAIFVHMVKTYYEQGLCPWVDEDVLESMVERANKLDPILIGKQAPQLMMMDTLNQLHSSYEFRSKYTVMWFWDVDCSHCKSATPKLAELYHRAKDSLDFDVFAVCMSADTAAWKKFLRTHDMPWTNVGGNVANMNFVEVFDVHSTPMIYVLNEKKEIIVKKLAIEELEDFLRRYSKGEIKY